MALARLWSRLLGGPAPKGHGARAEYEVSELFQAPAQLSSPGQDPLRGCPSEPVGTVGTTTGTAGWGDPRGRRAIGPGQTQLVGGSQPRLDLCSWTPAGAVPGHRPAFPTWESAGG